MSVLQPGLILDHVADITPELLLGRELRGVLLDLDNTLIEYGSYAEASEVQAWAADLLLSGVKLYLLSNAMPERVRFWTDKLGFAGHGLASKPMPSAFKRAARNMGLAPREVAMVGDQLFTDVLGGNLAGMFTIMVRPLIDNGLPHTRLTRKVERLVLRRYGAGGHNRAKDKP